MGIISPFCNIIKYPIHHLMTSSIDGSEFGMPNLFRENTGSIMLVISVSLIVLLIGPMLIAILFKDRRNRYPVLPNNEPCPSCPVCRQPLDTAVDLHAPPRPHSD